MERLKVQSNMANNSSLLYYTTVALLHRPFYSIPLHHRACRQASISIEKLLLLLEKTFGFRKVCSNEYCGFYMLTIAIGYVSYGLLHIYRRIRNHARC